MKLKTMSKFLLCFLIIGCMTGFGIAKADDYCSSEITTYGEYKVCAEGYMVEEYDDQYWHVAKFVCSCGSKIEYIDGKNVCSKTKCIMGIFEQKDPGLPMTADHTDETIYKCQYGKKITIQAGKYYCGCGYFVELYIESGEGEGGEDISYYAHVASKTCGTCTSKIIYDKNSGEYICSKSNIVVHLNEENEYIHYVSNVTTYKCESNKSVKQIGEDYVCDCGYVLANHRTHLLCQTCKDKQITRKSIKGDVVYACTAGYILSGNNVTKAHISCGTRENEYVKIDQNNVVYCTGGYNLDFDTFTHIARKCMTCNKNTIIPDKEKGYYCKNAPDAKLYQESYSGNFYHMNYYCDSCSIEANKYKVTSKPCTKHRDGIICVGVLTTYKCECAGDGKLFDGKIYYDGYKYWCVGTRTEVRNSQPYYISAVRETEKCTDDFHQASQLDPKFFCQYAKENNYYYFGCVKCDEGTYESEYTFSNVSKTCKKCGGQTLLMTKKEVCKEHKFYYMYYYMQDGIMYKICNECHKNNKNPIKDDTYKPGEEKTELGNAKKGVNGDEGRYQGGVVGEDGKLSSGSSQVIQSNMSADAFFNAGADKISNTQVEGLVNAKLGPIIHIQSLVVMFGILIAVIVGLIYGIQWMIAAPARRQELKSGMWPLMIGIILLAIGPKLAFSIYEILKANSTGTVTDVSGNMAGAIIGIIQTVGYIVAVIMMLIIAIQWFTAVPAKRQELKGKLINLAIGAIIIVSCTSLLNFIYTIAKSFNI